MFIYSIHRDNLSRIKYLSENKTPYLFTSTNLLDLLEDIGAVKTKMSIISLIGPRLVDPTAKHNELMELFEYAGEREKVEGILKKRATVLSSKRYGDEYRSRRTNLLSSTVRGQVKPTRIVTASTVTDETVEHDLDKIVESLTSKEPISHLTTATDTLSASTYNYEYDVDGKPVSNQPLVEIVDLNQPGMLPIVVFVDFAI